MNGAFKFTAGSLDGARTAAVFSACRRYRYRLDRVWDDTATKVLFVMLNPSAADETKNDPTVARCHERARRLNGGRHGAYRVCNLFALISPCPQLLESGIHAGDDLTNDAAITEACGWADTVVCAWGGSKEFIVKRGLFVVENMRRTFDGPLFCLAVNASGTPRHPLYVSHDAPLVEWRR